MWGQHGVCLLSLPTPPLCSDQILARVKLKIRGAKAKTSDCMSAVTNPISRREGRLTGHSHVTSSLDFLKKVLEVTLDPVSDRSPWLQGRFTSVMTSVLLRIFIIFTSAVLSLPSPGPPGQQGKKIETINLGSLASTSLSMILHLFYCRYYKWLPENTHIIGTPRVSLEMKIFIKSVFLLTLE